MESKSMKHKHHKRIIIGIAVIIYLYASYQLKIVHGLNQNYREVGMNNLEIVLGALIVLAYMLKDIYSKIKLRRILDNQLRKHQGRK